jgi:uncharacterized protein DUF742
MTAPDDQPAVPGRRRVRPYAMTGGRTRPSHEDLEIEALVATTSIGGADAEADRGAARHRRPLPVSSVCWWVTWPRSTWSSSTGPLRPGIVST